jgi:hypothetical protein
MPHDRRAALLAAIDIRKTIPLVDSCYVANDRKSGEGKFVDGLKHSARSLKPMTLIVEGGR